MGLKARFKIDGCSIKVILNITIFAENRSIRGRINWNVLSSTIKESIEEYWNDGVWNINGCYINFAVNVRADTKNTSHWFVSGDNEVKVNDEPPSYTSVVIGGDKGIWTQNDNGWVYAHEAGHLLGLRDDYIEVSTNPRKTRAKRHHEGHMMAEHSGSVANHEVREILTSNNVKCPCECRGL